MRNLLKKWTLMAAVLGTTMLAWGGCLGGKNWTLITAWLNEDLFS